MGYMRKFMAAQKAYYSECQAHLESVEGIPSFRSATMQPRLSYSILSEIVVFFRNTHAYTQIANRMVWEAHRQCIHAASPQYVKTLVTTPPTPHNTHIDSAANASATDEPKSTFSFEGVELDQEEAYKGKMLYDYEAQKENELTVNAGEVRRCSMHMYCT